jgi:predicted DCC family thiol-disulfide oxidoreductase YuxK
MGAEACGRTFEAPQEPPPDETVRDGPVSGALRRLFDLDLRSAALARFWLGLVILADLIGRAADLEAHYTELGVTPQALVRREWGQSCYSSLHWWLSPYPAAEALLFAVHGVFALALAIGFRTRIATVGCWLLMLSLYRRDPTLATAGDRTLQLLLFWSMFLPLGGRWSIDSALDTAPRRRGNAYASVASGAILLQVCFVYWFSVGEKLLGEWPGWRELYAVSYALGLDSYVTASGVWLREFQGVLPALTLLTLGWESLGPMLPFVPGFRVPGRVIAIAGFAALHLGFGQFLNLGLFPWMSIAGWVFFVPGAFWDSLELRLRTPRRLGLAMFYDGDCGFCQRTSLILRTLLVLSESPLRPAQEDPAVLEEMRRLNSWVVIDHRGRHHHRFEALAYVMRSSPIAWPLGVVLSWGPLVAVGDVLYGLVARNRTLLGRLTWFLRARPLRVRPRAWENVAAGLALGFVVFLAFAALVPPLGRAVPAHVHKVSRLLRLTQSWAMFTYGSTEDGWFSIAGTLADGSEVELLDGGPLIRETRRVPTGHYPTFRWKQVLHIAPRNAPGFRRPHIAAYYCRAWNQEHASHQRLLLVRIVFMRKHSGFDGSRRYEALELHELSCPGPGE